MKHKLLNFNLHAILTACFLSFTLISNAQYCDAYFDDSEYEFISNVNFAGINNTTADISGTPSDYTSMSASVSPGGSYLLSVTITADADEYVYAFIDWDQDDVLDGTDEVYTLATGTDDDGTYSQAIVVPAGALAGSTRMRVMIAYNVSTPDPCLEENYGEVEDYSVNVVTTACAGTPAPGNTVSTVASVCETTNFILGLQNQVTGTGVTFQWQSSPDGVTYTNIAGATSSSYSSTQSASTYYQCVVTCGGTPANSTPLQVVQNSFLNCYCVSKPEYPDAEDILNVTLGTLNNTSDCSETGTGASEMNMYSDYTGVAAPSLARGVGYNFSVEIGACFDAYENMTKVYIDYNQDGDFEDSDEEVYVTDLVVDGPHTETGTISIPLNAVLGTTRMRVITSETTFDGDITPCGNGGNDNYYAGETEDYFVTIAPAPSCPQPTAFQWSDGNTSSADFTWTPGGAETAWVIEYGAPGFTLGAGTQINVSTDPEVTIPGLPANTMYQVYVWAVCGPTDESMPTGPVSFNTYGFGQYLEADMECGPSFTDISATGEMYTLEDDDNASLTLPFPVYYQGALYTTATVGNNGAIEFGTTNAEIDFDNVSMDTAPLGLYPFWDDMGGSGPGIWSATTGTAPNRKFIIQWNKDRLNAENNPLNFELIIDEATMEIYFVYDDVFTGNTDYNSGASATIGAAGPVDITLSENATDYLDNNECAHFYYTNCPKPQDLEFSNITIDEFSMDWVEGLSNETEWSVEFGAQGFLPGTGTMLSSITSSDQQIPNLDPLTTYEVHVYAVCANGNISAPLMGSVQTLPLCADPYALYAETAADSIFGSWQWTETEVPLTGFNLQYGATDFDLYGAGSTTVEADGMNFEDTIHDVDLMAGVTYDLWVQAVCDTDTSNFIGPFSVTMPLTNDTVCYAEALMTDGTVYTFTNDGATVNNSVVSNQEQSIAPPTSGLQTTTGWGNNTISFSTWFTFVAPASGQVRISGVDQGFDGQMAVYKVGNCAQFSTFQRLAANDNEIGGTSLAPNFTVCGLTPGSTYYLMHDSYSTGTTGTYSVKINAINLQAGTAGPLSEICSGTTVNLFDNISGNDANGTWIPTIPSVMLEDDSLFNSSGLAYQVFDFEYRMVDGCAYDSIVAHIEVFPPSSAGTDGSLIVCRNEPFNLLEGLGGNVDMGGTWYNPTSVVIPGGNAVAENFPGQYNYKYIVGNGVCPNDTAKVIVSVQNNCNYLGMDEAAFEGFSLYPNPTEGFVYVTSGGSAEVFNYEVLDLNGRKVMAKENAINGTAVTEIDLNSVETGIYMIHVYNGNAEKTFRVVVK